MNTRYNDETIKHTAYQSLPSMMEYVLIEQDFVDVEVYRRSLDWMLHHYFLGDDVWFESLDFKLWATISLTPTDDQSGILGLLSTRIKI